MQSVPNSTVQAKPQVRIIRRREVEAITGLSRSSIYAKLSKSSKYFDPDFPPSVSLGAYSVGWIESEIDAWVISRADMRQS